MFDSKLEILQPDRVHQYTLTRDAEPLPYATVVRLWQRDEVFRDFFRDLLAHVPFLAFRWEMPPVTTGTANRAFEFVLLDSPGLARRPDPAPFTGHFEEDSEAGIVVFENLGKDATLVVPSPRDAESAYGHLAAFTRQAPASQQHALWQTVGQTMQERLSTQPVWLSTAGGGVSWLHVRLDARPKYYGFAPYRQPPE